MCCHITVTCRHITVTCRHITVTCRHGAATLPNVIHYNSADANTATDFGINTRGLGQNGLFDLFKFYSTQVFLKFRIKMIEQNYEGIDR